MANLLLISHGSFAKGLCHSIEMIIGKDQNLLHCTLDENEGLEKFKEDAGRIITEIANSSGKLLMVCDLNFGSPNVAAFEIACQLIGTENFRMVTGANLPMMLELCIANQSCPDDLDYLVDKAISMGREGIKDFCLKNICNDCEESL
jgi:PTS system mannose-specific IIA component